MPTEILVSESIENEIHAAVEKAMRAARAGDPALYAEAASEAMSLAMTISCMLIGAHRADEIRARKAG